MNPKTSYPKYTENNAAKTGSIASIIAVSLADNIFWAHIITSRANVVPKVPVVKIAMIASFENTTWCISSTIKLAKKDNKAVTEDWITKKLITLIFAGR